VLAKHDENYTAPEVAESLAKHVSDKIAAAEGAADCSSG
jgi:cytochrome c-type biogenesis protein CcmE